MSDEIHELLGIMEDEEFLEHYGVKGMKWGVRNAETLRKYAGAMHTRMSSVRIFGSAGAVSNAVRGLTNKPVQALGRAKARTVERIESAKAKHAEKREATKAFREEKRELRRESGLSYRKYHKLRKTTLKSHDPEVVARGMHLLTDDELSNKIKRLSTENQITTLAVSKAKGRENVKKARYEALTANPIYKLGADAVSGLAKDTLHSLGYDTVVMKGINPVLEQRVTSIANQKMKKFEAKENAKRAEEFRREEKNTKNVSNLSSIPKDNSYKEKFSDSKNQNAETFKPKNNVVQGTIESIETVWDDDDKRNSAITRGKRLLTDGRS